MKSSRDQYVSSLFEKKKKIKKNENREIKKNREKRQREVHRYYLIKSIKKRVE